MSSSSNNNSFLTSSKCGQAALTPLDPSANRKGVLYNLEKHQIANKLQSPKKKLLDDGTSGMEVFKVSKTGALMTRRLAFSPNHRSLYITTNKITGLSSLIKYVNQTKKESGATVIDISRIDSIWKGQLTQRFTQCDDPSMEKTSLSILFLPSKYSYNNHATLETIDLIVPDQRDFQLLVTTLQDLMILYQVQKRSLGKPLRLLEYHSVDMGKSSSSFVDANMDRISISEFYELCSRLNAPPIKYKGRPSIKAISKKSSMNLVSDPMGTMYRDLVKELKQKQSRQQQQLSLQEPFPMKRSQSLDSGYSSLSAENHELPLWALGRLLQRLENLSHQQTGVEKVQDEPIARLWNDILHTDPVPYIRPDHKSVETSVTMEDEWEASTHSTISNVAFLSFIRSHQKEYHAQPNHTSNLIKKLEQQISTSDDLMALQKSSTTTIHSSKRLGVRKEDEEEIFDMDLSVSGKDDRLSKVGFMEYLFGDSNELMDPARSKQSDDMTYPLSSYWIRTCHDTYLNCEKLDSSGMPGPAGSEMYMNALSRGVRCLELDVWDSVPKDPKQQASSSVPAFPVISHQQPSYGALPFQVVLKIVAQYIDANPDTFPILLNVENHCSFTVQKVMAKQLYDVLGSKGLLVVPDESQAVHTKDLLPSPASMIGKVVVIGKRPEVIKEGARIVNDDYDDENDDFGRLGLANVQSRAEEDDEEAEANKNGIVIGFDAAGPVRSTDPDPTLTRHTASELLWMAKNELEKRKMNAVEAELRANEAAEKAARLKHELDTLITRAGLRKENVLEMAKKLNGESANPDDFERLLEREADEGVEVQEFFAGAVEGARDKFAEADAEAIAASGEATTALQKLNAATKKLREAEKVVEEARGRNRKIINEYKRAASRALTMREDYNQMQERVIKLKELLQQMDKSASSAQNVVSTAVTEANISEKRAVETESRAQRAAKGAAADRVVADDETHREEVLEKEASIYHEKLRAAAEKIDAMQQETERSSEELNKIEDQIKLLENSSQYLSEREEASGEEKKISSPSSGKAMARHAKKIQERNAIAEKIKQLSINITRAEAVRVGTHQEFEVKAIAWKEQANIAAKARKQADRSTHLAEDLASHAEEEREAANLRRIARERAQSSVSSSGENRESLKAQLKTAEKQVLEAKLKADEARLEEKHLSHYNDSLENNDGLEENLERQKEERDEALRAYEEKKVIQELTDAKASEARRLFDTSESVYKDAMRNASKEKVFQNTQKHNDRKVIIKFNQSTLAYNKAEHELEKVRYTQSLVDEQELIVQRAKEFMDKTERVAEIPTSLAKMTFLNTTKFRAWPKSFAQPNTNVHSFAQDVLEKKIFDKESSDARKLKEFTLEHMCRTFPPWRATNTRSELNYDPMYQWALGCQLVAMNSSTFDKHILQADGRFRTNGSSGYVLKPSFLRHLNLQNEDKATWNIRVLCGAYLPSPKTKKHGARVNPYVKVSVYGPTKEETQFTTSVVNNNGINPVWDDKEGFEFSCDVQAMSILAFSVWDKGRSDGRDGLIGAAAMPVSCIREGYRSVVLFDEYHSRVGAHAFSSLLVQATKRDGR
ncbi:unnamed protein product [Cylindrotheca closterium]|uniref:phosphoinositide phospholipase C n=1 Tax=Cylindrotheca closterium TaxID=2856 RepID=A0AAD2FL23_9STRA|nr:unnamed protein product [Cylindrotheca closterium]